MVALIQNPVGALPNPVGALPNPVGALQNPVGALLNPVGALLNPVGALLDKSPVVDESLFIGIHVNNGVTENHGRNMAVEIKVVCRPIMTSVSNPRLNDVSPQPDVVIILAGVVVRGWPECRRIAFRKANEIG